jgi:hypothetical protein
MAWCVLKYPREIIRYGFKAISSGNDWMENTTIALCRMITFLLALGLVMWLIVITLLIERMIHASS